MIMNAHRIIETAETQSLLIHNENVANYCRGFLSSLGLSYSAFVIGLIHDLGKYSNAFQIHLKGSSMKIDHAYVGAKYIYLRHLSSPDFYTYILCISVLSHHSYLMNFIDADGKSDFLRRLKKEDYYDECIENFNSEFDEPNIDEAYFKATQEIKKVVDSILKRYPCKEHKYEMFNFEISLLIKLLYSALIDADCLDTARFFEHETDHLEEKNPSWKLYYTRLVTHLQQYATDTELNMTRKEISEQCDRYGEHDLGIYRLNVPTGGGKTLASIRFALKHAMQHSNIKHIIYVAPFLSILDQSSKTLEEILFPEGYDDSEFLQHYSSVIVEDEESHMAYTKRWNSAIILTSMVRFMETLFKGRKSEARRMHQLANSIIIIDEAQSIPPKLLHMFNTAINFLHYVCHSTILICTATQPQFHKMNKPILFSDNANLIENSVELYRKMKRVKIISHYTNDGFSMIDIANDVIQLSKRHKQVMIIMNTKAEAYELYTSLENSNPVNLYYLTSSMCIQHRFDVLKEIRKKLILHQPVCLVSTSVIEAGVDISFPCVIRALAGMDNIIQCAGRCNRNNELQQKGKLGEVHLYNIKDENLQKLTHIEKGKHATLLLLTLFNENPSRFNNDLTSVEAMEMYYKLYRSEMQDRAYDYPIKDNTIYGLLSSQFRKYDDDPMLALFPFRFEDAGKEFQVIDRDMVDVIVPYCNQPEDDDKKMQGDTIISILLSDNATDEERKRALKCAERYSVGLYRYQLQQLDKSILKLSDFGTYTLNEKNYDKNVGILIDGFCSGIYI